MDPIDNSDFSQREQKLNLSIEFSTKEQIQDVIQKAYEGQNKYRDFIINRFYVGYFTPKLLNIDLQKLFDKSHIKNRSIISL